MTFSLNLFSRRSTLIKKDLIKIKFLRGKAREQETNTFILFLLLLSHPYCNKRKFTKKNKVEMKP